MFVAERFLIESPGRLSLPRCDSLNAGRDSDREFEFGFDSLALEGEQVACLPNLQELSIGRARGVSRLEHAFVAPGLCKTSSLCFPRQELVVVNTCVRNHVIELRRLNLEKLLRVAASRSLRLQAVMHECFAGGWVLA